MADWTPLRHGSWESSGHSFRIRALLAIEQLGAGCVNAREQTTAREIAPAAQSLPQWGWKTLNQYEKNILIGLFDF
jgi:hypothetical protein